MPLFSVFVLQYANWLLAAAAYMAFKPQEQSQSELNFTPFQVYVLPFFFFHCTQSALEISSGS